MISPKQSDTELQFGLSFLGNAVVFTEYISIPKNSIKCVGWRTDFFIFVKKLSPCRRYISMSRVSSSYHWSHYYHYFSSRSIMRCIFDFLNREIGIFIIFVNILSVGTRPKHMQRNWYMLFFHLNFWKFWEFWFKGTENMHLWGRSCTLNPLYVGVPFKEINLPFWNVSRRYVDPTFSNLLLVGNPNFSWQSQKLIWWISWTFWSTNKVSSWFMFNGEGADNWQGFQSTKGI